jgi:glycerol uptake facilitator-like aquaporin
VTLNLANPNLMMVAASFGFGILCLAQIFGPLSGAHINCAVSFGLFVSGRCSFMRALCFTLSQMLGSVFGALFLWMIFGSNWPAARAFGSNSWDESVFNGGQVFFAEMMGTMLLMFNVLSTIDIPMKDGGPLGVFPIAMSVMVAHLFLIPIDGCSINPTRSFGPSLVAAWAGIGGSYYHQQYLFWFGPLFGAGLGAFLYEFGPLKPENFAGGGDMGDALFSANKGKGKDDEKVLSWLYFCALLRYFCDLWYISSQQKPTKTRSLSIVGSKNKYNDKYINAADPPEITEIRDDDADDDYDEIVTDKVLMTKSPMKHYTDD